jgi:hypothetical protein
MVRIVICTALLAGFIAALKFGLYQAFSAWGLGPYLAFCAGGCVLLTAAAFAFDRLGARSPRSTPRELNDRPPSMK